MDLIECGKVDQKKTIRKFILLSSAPADVAAKLSLNYQLLAEQEKEFKRELLDASKFCEKITSDLVSVIAGSKNIELLLKSIDNQGVQFVDILVNCNQRNVVSHYAVQQYLSDLWDSNLKMSGMKMILIFLCTLCVPIIWILLSLPISIRFKKSGLIINRMPIIKFICFFVSHLYFIVLLFLTCVQPLVPITSMNSAVIIPYYHEWILLAWISGLVAAELSNPSDKGGLGMLKIIVMILTTTACIFHVISFFFNPDTNTHYELLYARNVIFAVSILVSSVQLLEFLTFHYLFGPWAIIIRTLMIDLLRFLVILAIFLFGFTCLVTAVYQNVYPDNTLTAASVTSSSSSLTNPLATFEMLFFSLFGLVDPNDLPTLTQSPIEAIYIEKVIFGCYMIIAIIVLINTLIAMLASSYERIEKQSDIEWKFGRAKLIRNMTKSSTDIPTPFILVTQLVRVIVGLIKFKGIFLFLFH